MGCRHNFIAHDECLEALPLRTRCLCLYTAKESADRQIVTSFNSKWFVLAENDCKCEEQD